MMRVSRMNYSLFEKAILKKPDNIPPFSEITPELRASFKQHMQERLEAHRKSGSGMIKCATQKSEGRPDQLTPTSFTAAELQHKKFLTFSEIASSKDQYTLGAVAYAIEKSREIIRQWMPHLSDLCDDYAPSAGTGHRRKFRLSMIAKISVASKMIDTGVKIKHAFDCVENIEIEKIKYNDAFVFWSIGNSEISYKYMTEGLDEDVYSLIKLVGSGSAAVSVIPIATIIEAAVGRIQDRIANETPN